MSDPQPVIDAVADTASDWVEAHRHRRALRARVIGVTGSCGKTTTKNLIHAILSSRFRGHASEGSLNCGADLVRSVLAVQCADEYWVQELGAWGPGTLDAGVELVRPNIAVITNFRNDHYSAFHGPRGAQAEKSKLVACLPSAGKAVLNWDDPLVRALASQTSADIISYGQHAGSLVRASDVSASWPEPLTFQVAFRDRKVRVRTRLLAEHQLSSALAAVAVGLLFGFSVEEAAALLEFATPTFRRMSPSSPIAGVTFIRDDYKAPADSLPEVLAFLKHAKAPRKLAVVGTIADFPGRSRRTYSQVAWDALRSLDAVIFVGERAAALWGTNASTAEVDQRQLRQKLEHGGWPQPWPSDGHMGQMFVFRTVQEADGFLSNFLMRGDLVLLKGSGPADHLERLLLSHQGPVACWATHCRRVHCCDECPLMRSGEGHDLASSHITSAQTDSEGTAR